MHPSVKSGKFSSFSFLNFWVDIQKQDRFNRLNVIMSVSFTGIHLFVVFLERSKMTIIIMTTLGETVEVSRVRYDCVILTCKKK